LAVVILVVIAKTSGDTTITTPRSGVVIVVNLVFEFGGW